MQLKVAAVAEGIGACVSQTSLGYKLACTLVGTQNPVAPQEQKKPPQPERRAASSLLAATRDAAPAALRPQPPLQSQPTLARSNNTHQQQQPKTALVLQPAITMPRPIQKAPPSPITVPSPEPSLATTPLAMPNRGGLVDVPEPAWKRMR